MIENYTGVPLDYFVIGFAIGCIALLVLVIVLLVKMSGLKKKLSVFLSGPDGTTLEDTLIKRLQEVEHLTKTNNENERNIEDIHKKMQYSIDKYGLVKYDALDELGGKLSFAVTLLDERNNGFIINNMHGREGSYTYLKEVINGNTVANLSDEEKLSLDKAISGEDR